MSFLVECIEEENAMEGHARRCAFAAGGDCTCGRDYYPMTVIPTIGELLDGAVQRTVNITNDLWDSSFIPPAKIDDIPF